MSIELHSAIRSSVVSIGTSVLPSLTNEIDFFDFASFLYGFLFLESIIPLICVSSQSVMNEQLNKNQW